ncbi:MAG: restriction endonuclease subunit S [bacterium]|nr:restriction endonuclease subunit S [bacterium]
MKTNLLQKNIPKDWSIKKIKDLLDFEQPIKYIVESSSYTPTGKTAVLTANKSFVLGYTNETDGVYTDTPAIIFDDFTTDSKYVDFPFKVKSSAIKILRNKDTNTDLKFVYEIMKSFIFPIANHKRHYISQYQDLDIVVPPIKEQKKIADILSSVDNEIEQNEVLIKKYEDLKIGILADFLNSKTKKTEFKRKKLEALCNFTTGKLNSNRSITGGKYPFFTCSKETYAIDQYSFDCEAILLAGNNAAGIYSVKHYSGKFDAYQRTYVITIKNENELDYVFLKEIINAKLNLLKNMSLGSTTKFLTIKLLHNIEINIPSISEQRRIAKILLLVDQNIIGYKSLREKFKELKKGLVLDLLSGKVRTKQ